MCCRCRIVLTNGIVLIIATSRSLSASLYRFGLGVSCRLLVIRFSRLSLSQYHVMVWWQSGNWWKHCRWYNRRNGASIPYASLRNEVTSNPNAIPEPVAKICACGVAITHPKLPRPSRTLPSDPMMIVFVSNVIGSWVEWKWMLRSNCCSQWSSVLM